MCGVLQLNACAKRLRVSARVWRKKRGLQGVSILPWRALCDAVQGVWKETWPIRSIQLLMPLPVCRCLQVMSRLNPKHQTLLFSATMPREIEDLANGYLNNPVTVKVRGQERRLCGEGWPCGACAKHRSKSPCISAAEGCIWRQLLVLNCSAACNLQGCCLLAPQDACLL